MSIQLLSVSHKAAPLEIRQLFAFSLSQQIQLMRALKEDGQIKEVVVLATCNRTEVYVYSEEENERIIYDKMMDIVTRFALENYENSNDTIYLSEYYRLYHGEKAIHHLFAVAAGLDSMVIGEDQILGQVKRAHEFAREQGMCGVYLNTFFRYCVTGSKRVKTETELSKTSISTATLAVKALQEQLGSLQGKNIMIIGASGKIGSIVLKNLQSIGGMHLYMTMRGVNAIKKEEKIDCTHLSHVGATYEIIPYEERYHYIAKMDGIVSATASPHYTITEAHFKKYHTGKKTVFVDLAVPMDIEHKIQELEGTICYHMDDLQNAAKDNNERKKEEAKYAKKILKDYETQFKKWFLFQRSLQTVHTVIDHLTKTIEQKGSKKALSQFFYQMREDVDPEQLEVFLQAMEFYEKKEILMEE